MNAAEGQRWIRQLLGDPDCRMNYSDHVRARMAERGVLASQIRRVLRGGLVMEFQGVGRFPDGLRFLVQGYDEDGRNLGVIVDVYPGVQRLDIVTVMTA